MGDYMGKMLLHIFYCKISLVWSSETISAREIAKLNGKYMVLFFLTLKMHSSRLDRVLKILTFFIGRGDPIFFKKIEKSKIFSEVQGFVKAKKRHVGKILNGNYMVNISRVKIPLSSGALVDKCRS